MPESTGTVRTEVPLSHWIGLLVSLVKHRDYRNILATKPSPFIQSMALQDICRPALDLLVNEYLDFLRASKEVGGRVAGSVGQ